MQLRTDGTPSTRASVSALWGPKTLDNLVDLDLMFTVKVEAAVLRRLGRAPGDEYANCFCLTACGVLIFHAEVPTRSRLKA